MQMTEKAMAGLPTGTDKALARRREREAHSRVHRTEATAVEPKAQAGSSGPGVTCAIPQERLSGLEYFLSKPNCTSCVFLSLRPKLKNT